MVEGFSLDYLILNITGYTLYTIYSSIGYFTDIKGAGTVVIGDLIFVYHGLLMILIQSIQCFIYERGKNKISKQAVVIVICIWLVIVIETLLQSLGAIASTQYWNPVSALGYGKLVVTLIKYTPPAYWNYKRKSTKGWSIFNILLDLVGGIFSLASGGLSVEDGLNITKVILGFITIIYDLLFVFQHYCLYRKKSVNQNDLKSEKTLEETLEESLIVQETDNMLKK